MPPTDSRSLFAGVPSAVEAVLGKYKHRSTFLKKKPLGFALGSEVATRVHSAIALVFPGLVSAQCRHSRENWRCNRPWDSCAEANRKREVGLERALVRACKTRGRQDWWNQVPVASGLVSSRADKRCAIDLVRDRGSGSYDFVELKIRSDNPLYATVEILQYGFAWLLSREHKEAPGTLLDARDIRLNVLAPDCYYRGVDLRAFEEGVSSGVSEIASASLPKASMAFRMVRFPKSFCWPGKFTDAELCGLLDSLFPA